MRFGTYPRKNLWSLAVSEQNLIKFVWVVLEIFNVETGTLIVSPHCSQQNVEELDKAWKLCKTDMMEKAFANVGLSLNCFKLSLMVNLF